MSEVTKIEWCDSTFNPWIGCTRVSTADTGGGGCDGCYAAVSTPARTMGIVWGPKSPRHRTAAATWAQPGKWNREHDKFFAQHGRRRRVFCASLADVFDNEVDLNWIRDLFDLIRATPHLDWLLLTKRIGNVERLYGECHLDPPDGGSGYPWPSNAILGITVVNQKEADRDIPKALAVKSLYKIPRLFLSMEPLIGPVDLQPHLWVCCGCPEPGGGGDGFMQPPDPPSCCGNPELSGIDWVIVGGESGNTARPMHPDWARGLRDQCEKAGVPFLFKQWGEWLPGHHFTDALQEKDSDPSQSRYPCAQLVATEPAVDWDIGFVHASETYDDGALYRVGKKDAGRELDGRTWDGFPS